MIAGAVATAALLALAIPLVLAATRARPSAKFLPEGNAARVSYERVAAVMGPGWPTPYNVVLVSKTKPITDKATAGADRPVPARACGRTPGSCRSSGPGELAATSKQLNALPKGLKDSTKLLKGGKKDLGRLQAGLGQAGRRAP